MIKKTNNENKSLRMVTSSPSKIFSIITENPPDSCEFGGFSFTTKLSLYKPHLASIFFGAYCEMHTIRPFG